MKLLFDQNISYRIVKRIESEYPDSGQVKRLGLADSTDVELWDYARQNGYSIVTFDSDFMDMANLKAIHQNYLAKNWEYKNRFDHKLALK